MFEVWDKEKLKSLTKKEKDEWFDVLNQGLERDRNILFSDPNLAIRQQ